MPKRRRKRKLRKESKMGVAIVLAFMFILFCFFVVTGAQQKMAPLQTVVPIGWGIKDVEPQVPALCYWEFYMVDVTTEDPIPNVRIRIVMDDPILGHGEYNVYTNDAGYADITTLQYQWSEITAEHLNYETRQDTFDGRQGHIVVKWHLTPKGDGDGVSLTLYAQVDEKRDLIKAAVHLGEQQFVFDETYPQKAIIWGLELRNYSMRVEGYWLEWHSWGPLGGYYEQHPFSWVITVDTTESTWWVDVLTGDVWQGEPPYVPPPVDPWKILTDFIAWLTQYWLIVVIGAVVLYALPHVATMIAAVRGTQPSRGVDVVGVLREARLADRGV